MADKINKSWYLHPLTLNCADGAIIEQFQASAEDINGRGIALTVTENGETRDLTGCTVSLIWRDKTDAWGLDKFKAVSAQTGRYEVTYSGEMAANAPTEVHARIMITIGDEQITTSREFIINIARPIISDDEAKANPSFSAFAEGVIALNTLERDVKAAESARVSAENKRIESEKQRRDAEDERSSRFFSWGLNVGYVDDAVAVAAIDELIRKKGD